MSMSLETTKEDGLIIPPDLLRSYFDSLNKIERLHRLLLDTIKDEFERVGIHEINSVQAMLLFNIGSKELSAGELRSRGFYQGSNVSYNLKKLVDGEYLDHRKPISDRRAVRVKLTEKGNDIRALVEGVFQRHCQGLLNSNHFDQASMSKLEWGLSKLERFWVGQIRYLY